MGCGNSPGNVCWKCYRVGWPWVLNTEKRISVCMQVIVPGLFGCICFLHGANGECILLGVEDNLCSTFPRPCCFVENHSKLSANVQRCLQVYPNDHISSLVQPGKEVRINANEKFIFDYFITHLDLMLFSF